MPLVYPALRDDLTFHPVRHRGRQVIYVKDALRAAMFGLNALQVSMMQKLDGRRSPAEIAAALENEFEQEVPPAKVERFIGFLREKLLLDVSAYPNPEPRLARAIRALAGRRRLLEAAPDGSVAAGLVEQAVALIELDRPIDAASHLHAALEVDPASGRARALLAAVHEGYFRGHRTTADHMTMVHLWNPDRFLGWLDQWAGRFVFSGWGLMSIAALVAVTIPAAVNLTSPPLDSIRWVDFVLLRTVIFLPEYFVHEVLGHGFACKHFGGKVEDVGLMLFYGVVPGAYTDVTDVHRFAERRERVIVYLAGVVAEVPMLCFWCLLYFFTDDRFVLHNAIFLWLVYSLYLMAKNLVPTMVGFDGYYALAHAWELPDLALDAQGVVRRAVGEALLGRHSPPRSPAERRLLRFGWAAALTFVAFSVVVVWQVLVPLAGQLFGAPGVLAVAVYAVLTLGRRAFGQLAWLTRFVAAHRAQLSHKRRLAMVAAVATLVVLLAWPWPLLVDGDAVVQPQRRAEVVAQEAGLVDSLMVHEGEVVRAGQVLARLRDDELTASSNKLKAKAMALAATIRKLESGSRAQERQASRSRLESSYVEREFARRARARSMALAAAGLATLEQDTRWHTELAVRGATAEGEGQRDALVLSLTRAEELEAAKAELRSLEALQRVFEGRLARLTLTSPIDGVVVRPGLADVKGSAMRAGQTMLEVHALDFVFVEVSVPPERPLAGLALGRRLEFRAVSTPALSLTSTVRLVRPRVDTRARVVVESTLVPNPGWPTGHRARARLFLPPRSIAYQVFVAPLLPLVDVDTWQALWG
jgi:multidrug resistance efflux pump